MIPFASAAVLLTLLTLLSLFRPWQAGRRIRHRVHAEACLERMRALDRDHRAGRLSEDMYAGQRDAVLATWLQGPVPASAVARRAGWQLALAALIAGGATGLYLILGRPDALSDQAAGSHDMNERVSQLARRLAEAPGDSQGWIMLARSYRALGRQDEARDAYGHIGEALHADPALLTEYADLLAMKAGGHLGGEPLQLVEEALKLEPAHPMALWLAGTAAFDRHDDRAAKGYWERLLPLLPEDSQDARSIRASLDEIRQREAAPSSRKPPVSAAGAPVIRGRVTLAPELAAKAHPEDALFVFARAAEGPRMPLAVLRAKVADLPFDYVLDGSTSMMPGTGLAEGKPVVVEAKISASGDAKASPGDLFGQSAPLLPGKKKVAIVIDQLR